ncbi:MAG: ABC transporter permease subunit [Gammaproteobacteria bacterium]|nr:ABC transporter permease subunit [Gammaproteobacteria bacterium]
MKRAGRFARGMLGAGLAFLYLPIAALIVYSFNASQAVGVWGGFSTRWYGALLDDEQILAAAWLSLRVAALNASLAALLGTLAAIALVRFGAFRGRALFAALTTAPLVMPEVILGLSALLTFVALEGLIGWPAGRGATTIVIAHVTFCMAYVAVIVQSRLAGQDPALEEAALDLGATPAVAFLRVTLPLIAPAVAAGWLLAFTLSLDDLVVASFVSGPGASTLPMVIYSKVRLGLSPEINALATLLVAAVALTLAISAWLMLRGSARSNGQD